MERFGSRARHTRPAEELALARGPSVALTGGAFFGKLSALSLAAICFGLVNFGLLLWLPADLVAKGYSMELTSRLLAQSATIAFPSIGRSRSTTTTCAGSATSPGGTRRRRRAGPGD